MFKSTNLKLDSRILAIVSAFVLQVFFFAPLEVYLNNIVEFSARFWHLVLLFLGVSTVLVAAFYLLARRWPFSDFYCQK